jgi:hypothetical protein
VATEPSTTWKRKTRTTNSPDSPERATPRTDARPSLLQRIPAALGFIALAVGVFSAVVAALFTTFPGLRPDPRERAEATITNLAVDEDVSQRQFFQRIGTVPGVCTKQQLDRKGTAFYLRVDASGFKRSEVDIKWFTYDIGNRQRVDSLSSTYREKTVFKPSAPINRQIAQVWVPWPAKVGGEYSVRFELYSGDVLRAFVDSRQFRVPPPLEGARKPWCKPLAQQRSQTHP